MIISDIWYGGLQVGHHVHAFRFLKTENRTRHDYSRHYRGRYELSIAILSRARYPRGHLGGVNNN